MKKTIIALIAVLLLPVTFAGDEQIFKGDEWLAVDDNEVHRIKLIDVTSSGDACGIEVDGETHWIDVGADARINGVYIKVFDAYPVHSQTQDNDACEIFISGSLTKEYRTPFIAEVDDEPEEDMPEEEEEINITEPVISAEENVTGTEVNATFDNVQEGKKPSLWEWIKGLLRALFGK